MKKFDEVSPAGWSGTVKAMKKHKEIDNPFALAWHMKKKGNKPHYKEMPGKSSKAAGEPQKKEKYKNEGKMFLSFGEWKQQKERQLAENAELTTITDLGISSRDDYGDLSQWNGVEENSMRNRWLETCQQLVAKNDLDENSINWNSLAQYYTQGATPKQAIKRLFEMACCPACQRGDFANCTCKKKKSRKK